LQLPSQQIVLLLHFRAELPKFRYADKLFQLSTPTGWCNDPWEFVFSRLPWETVIKAARGHFSESRDHLKDYGDAFISFLSSAQLIDDDFVDADFFGTADWS